jgi:hypothetical protein
MSQSLLTLVCPPSLERPITNWLFEQDMISGFTSMPAYGHGSDPATLSLTEQVEGRKKQTLFQIIISPEISEEVINLLKKDFKGTEIHYWLSPITSSGSLSKID